MPQLKVTVRGGGKIIFGKKELTLVLRKAGQEVAATARASIAKKLTKAQVSRGVVRGASAPGQPPMSRTGELRSSIKTRVWRNGEGVTVSDTAPYASSLEVGAVGGGGKKGSGRKRQHRRRSQSTAKPSSQRVLLARPFMEPALDAKRASIETRMKLAVNDGFAWVREP
jgi:hypothetical protein